MNILVIQQAPDIGGAELFMADLVGEWVKLGNQVTALTSYEPLQELFKKKGALAGPLAFNLDIMGNRRGFLKTALAFPMAAAWYRGTLVRERQADVLLLSGQTDKLLATALAKRLKIPVVWLEYPPMQMLLRRNLGIPGHFYRCFSRVPKTIITLSQRTGKSLIEKTGIPKNKVVRIPAGSHVPSAREVSKARSQAAKMRNKLGVSGKYMIGNISRLAEEKGQEHLIKAFALVQKKSSKTALVLAGRGPDEERLKRLSKRLKLTNVHFLGFAEDRNATLAMMDLFVFPACWKLEGFGIVLVEAMLMRRPVVALKCAPTTEILKDGETGILVKPRDPAALADAIMGLIKNKNSTRRMTESAFGEAKKRFDIKTTARRMLKVLQDAKTK